jgi:hypothetical protein
MEFMESSITVLRPKDYRAGEEDPNYVPGVVGSIVADTTNKVLVKIDIRSSLLDYLHM